MFKSIVVSAETPQYAANNLNSLYSQGWHFVDACPMPSSCAAVNNGHAGSHPHIKEIQIYPTCLVTLRKDTPDDEK